ncbi:MAG: glycosyltransferase family 4 protein [bacterium]|nr:glycosyltransferase family 4 protein [bacterium]
MSYKDPNYIRTQTLLDAFSRIENVQLFVIRNKHKGTLRYLDTFIRLVKFRLRNNADVFVLGFRAHESFWLFYPLVRKSAVVFDEFINIHDWLVSEHKILKENSLRIRLVDRYMKWVSRKSDILLTDTLSHKKSAEKLYGISNSKVVVVPVGTDETIFSPQKQTAKNDVFEVLFYGSMLPLHGLDTILESIKLTSKQNKNIHFTIVGGKGNSKMIQKIDNYIQNNTLQQSTKHIDWVDFKKLPQYISRASLCLGGPFGNTGQATRVITGKTFQFIAMGKPTIIGKNLESSVFTDEIDALVVEQDRSDLLSKKIIWAYDYPDKLSQIGKNARELYVKTYSVENRAKSLEPIINLVKSK